MEMKIIFNEVIFDKLKSSLKWDGKEKMAYLLCNCTEYKGSIKLLPSKLMVPEEKDYISRSAGHIEIDNRYISKVFRNAIKDYADVIQVHIHPQGAGGVFSGVDEYHEPILMKHVAGQVKGVYHASMVFSNDQNEIDGWFYDRVSDKLVPVSKIVVVRKDCLDIFIPRRSQNNKKNSMLRFDRTIKAFGKDAVSLLSHLDVGVVGASALGGPIIEMLARDGFKSITICDPDVIDETNLNRLVATGQEDIGKFKAEFYADYAKQINPGLEVVYFNKNFYDEEVQQAFGQVDLILGCVDSEARLSINSLAMANIIPYFDMGASIVRKDGKISFKGGQVYSVVPNRNVCLECSNVFNNLKKKFWSPEKIKSEKAAGYLTDDEDDDIKPLVSHLDYVIAGFGYHEMLSYIWGQSLPHFKLFVDMSKNKTSMAEIETGGCMICRDLLGQGDKVGIYAPQVDEKIDVPTTPEETEEEDIFELVDELLDN